MWIAEDASKGYLCDSTHPGIEMVIKSKRNNIIEIDMVLKKKEKQVCYYQIYSGKLEKYLPKKGVYMVS